MKKRDVLRAEFWGLHRAGARAHAGIHNNKREREPVRTGVRQAAL
jgi:hypothetical protein